MAVSFRQLRPAFAAEVSGVDCAKPLTAERTRNVRRTTLAGDCATIEQAELTVAG